MRILETAMTMGSAAIRTTATRAASTETLAEQTSKAKPHTDGRCDVIGVLESTGDATIDIRHQNAGVKVHARNRQIVDQEGIGIPAACASKATGCGS
jgi:hypothetical protein